MTVLNRLAALRHVLGAALVLGPLLGVMSARSVSAHSPVSAIRTATSTLVIGWARETRELDPAGNAANQDIWVMTNIYDELVGIAPNGKTLVPDLATHWTISNEGTVYTFFLRPNVVFSNGQKLTAADVVFCLKRAQNPAHEYAWTLTAVKHIQAIGPSTVRITLKHPWAPFLSDLALFDAGVYPKAYFQKVGASYLSAHPLGTGPYMLQTWKRGQSLRLTKNPHYWATGQFPMTNVQFNLVPNDNTRLLEVEAGQIDVDNNPPFNQVAQVQGSKSAQVVINPSTLVTYLLPNTRVKPFGDPKVRQAINYAIDRTALVRAVLNGHGRPANSFIPYGAIAYDGAIPVPGHNLALAQKLMSESTVPKGFTVTMQVPAGDTVRNETAVIFKNEVAPLGIKVNIQQMDPTTLFNNQDLGKFTLTEGIFTDDIPDPDEIVEWDVDYTGGAYSYHTYYNSKAITRLSHQAERTNNPTARQQLYDRIQQIYARDVPFWSLYYSPFVNAVSNHVHGFSEVPLGSFNLRHVTKS